MTATNHAITGALIAYAVPHPIAIPLAFTAHFAMDALPHFGMGTETKNLRQLPKKFWQILLIDLSLAAVLLLTVPILLLGPPMWLIFTSMFACMSPDLEWGIKLLKKDLKKEGAVRSLFSGWHSRIQWKEFPAGIVIEAVWFVAAVGLLIIKP